MTCKDCIYRAMCYKHEHYGYGYEYNEKPCEMFKNKSNYAEVKHGEWIYRDSDLGWQKYECSNCNTLYTFYDEEELSNYCPHCGAKMDGGEEK